MSIEYFKLRYTPMDGKDAQHEGRRFFRNILPIEDLEYCTFGYEEVDKCNKPTHPHFHCHFAIDSEKYPKVNTGSLRKKIQRFLKDSEDDRKGNAVYSLSQEKDVKEPFRILRYPFKQKGRVFTNWEKLPEDFNLEQQILLSYEEWSHRVDENNKKLEKSLAPNTKDKLFEYLDTLKFTPSCSKKDILKFIIKYYAQEEKSMNKQTCLGYLNTALIKYGIMNEEEMADEWLR